MTAELHKKREVIDNVTLSASAIVTTLSGKHIYLVQQQDDTWGLPAGGFERKENGEIESPMEAVLREIQEETGYVIEDFRELKMNGVIILPAENVGDKFRLGFIFAGDLESYGYVSKPNDPSIKAGRFFGSKEVIDLIRDRKIYKPKFNVGILIYWDRHLVPDFSESMENLDSETIKRYASEFGY